MEGETSFIAQYLKNRGVTETPEEFFNLSWDDVEPPTNLDQIKEGAQLLINHIEADSRIGILVDVDMDGFTSSAVLFNYLTFFMEPGRIWDSYTGEIIPIFHKDKTHGLDDTVVMREIRDKLHLNLLIIPDASGSKDQCEALNGIGVDVLIIDHHDMKYNGNGESVIVINNQQSRRYTNKDLSGAGVVWQFCCYLDTITNWDTSMMWLDLVAAGLVGDVMNLKSRETRFLVQTGLANIHSPFLQAYQFNNYNMNGKPYTPHDISFHIAPMVNGVCRIGTQDEKLLTWKALTDTYATEEIPSGSRTQKGQTVPLVVEAIRVAGNAKSRQDRRRNKLVEKIHAIVQEENLINNKVIAFGFDDYEPEYRAMSGVVANTLASYYQRPIILTFKDSTSGNYVGSLRVPDTDNKIYENFKDQCNETGYFVFVAGHQQAAGCEVKAGHIEDIMDYFNKKYDGQNTELVYTVDFVMDAGDSRIPKMIEELSKIKSIHGQGLKEPRIAITHVKISPSTLRLVGQKKTTLWITSPSVKFINFRSSKEEFDSLKCPSDNSGVETFYEATIIGDQPDMNTWAEVTTPQLQIVDYEIENTKPHYVF